MYLKRLEIQGFKSFANKTTLEFGSGVTCVIGPNGTGKTNVADAVRWVLGEHASRALRARKTEDVIFAGSDKRAAMGVAEVNISLDNSGQWLPIDFDEVVVTRRAYRSGDNEYLINGSRVRLRDIIELFMRAQVGQNSYAFMGQGMVEQVLSLRPEDRRALIEEAAEVRLHRHKLEDAQEKLKATRENLDRVQLLIAEIAPRIAQLERQAGRAARYTDLAKELAATLHVWFSHQWQEANANLLAAIAAQDQAAEEFEQARVSAKSCEDTLGHLRIAIDERRREIGERDKRAENVQAYVRDLERRVALDEERARLIGTRLEELQAELQGLGEDLSAQLFSESSIDTVLVEQRLRDVREQLSQGRARLAAIDEESLRLQRSLFDREQATARAAEAAATLPARLAEASNAITDLRAAAAAAIETRRKLIAELARWAKEFAEWRATVKRAVLEIAAAQDERAALSATLAEREHTLGEADAVLRELRGKASTFEARIEVYETFQAPQQSPDAGVRMILEAGGLAPRATGSPEVQVSGVLGVIGQLIKVPPALERAIDAALAENLFALVLEREIDMREAEALLVAGDAGRATMYALDGFREVRPLNLTKERGIIGVASQLVRCESRFRRLVDTILGRTVVVESRALAEKVVRRGMAAAVATLDGVLLRPVGSVAAGRRAAARASFAVSRDGTDVPAELQAAQAAIAVQEAARATTLREVERARGRIAAVSKVVDESRERQAAAGLEIAALRVQLSAIGNRLSKVDASRRQGSAQVADLEARAAEIESRQTTRETARDEAVDAERNQRARLDSLVAERAVLLDRVAELAATVAQLDGDYRSKRSVTDSERMARERLERQIAVKKRRHAESRTESETVSSRLATNMRELATKSQELTALLGELSPAREELAQLESRERALNAESAEARARLREHERALTDARHEARIREEELQALKDTLGTEGFVVAGDEVARAPEPEPASAGDMPEWMRNGDSSSLPPVRGGSTIDAADVRDRIAELRAQIRSLGPVNEAAAGDYAENRQRYDYLTGQITDLEQTEAQLREAIGELDGIIRERFRTTFRKVNGEFERYFSAFFRGGTARLELGEPDQYGLPGVEIFAQPPGKKLGSLALLSGGERSLTAVALLFALLQANPSPICVLDEVDAALDEANVGRFVEELRALAQRTQFVIITHNRRTIEQADTIYGVSMGADNVSRVLSLRLAEIPHHVE